MHIASRAGVQKGFKGQQAGLEQGGATMFHVKPVRRDVRRRRGGAGDDLAYMPGG